MILKLRDTIKYFFLKRLKDCISNANATLPLTEMAFLFLWWIVLIKYTRVRRGMAERELNHNLSVQDSSHFLSFKMRTLFKSSSSSCPPLILAGFAARSITVPVPSAFKSSPLPF